MTESLSSCNDDTATESATWPLRTHSRTIMVTAVSYRPMCDQHLRTEISPNALWIGDRSLLSVI